VRVDVVGCWTVTGISLDAFFSPPWGSAESERLGLYQPDSFIARLFEIRYDRL
jgi:hypothetical protein